MTPAKKDQSGHVTVDQLSAFDKVLAECDQEAPIKFEDFLDSRCSCMYLFELLAVVTLQTFYLGKHDLLTVNYLSRET